MSIQRDLCAEMREVSLDKSLQPTAQYKQRWHSLCVCCRHILSTVPHTEQMWTTITSIPFNWIPVPSYLAVKLTWVA